MRRREFITLLGGAAVAWPLAARAQQQGQMYSLGFLIPSGRKAPWVFAFLDELRLNGFIEGQNLAIIPGGFDAQVDLLAERAEAIVNAAPDAIVGGPEPQQFNSTRWSQPKKRSRCSSRRKQPKAGTAGSCQLTLSGTICAEPAAQCRQEVQFDMPVSSGWAPDILQCQRHRCSLRNGFAACK